MIGCARADDPLDRQRVAAAIAVGTAGPPRRGESGHDGAFTDRRRDEPAAPPAAGQPARDRRESAQERAAGRDPAPVRVSLLGGFRLTRDGLPHELPSAVQRLVALLALRGPLAPHEAAALLAPHLEPKSAVAKLRRTLGRLRSTGLDILRAERSVLSLSEGVTVDAGEAEAFAARLAEGAEAPAWGSEHEQLLLELLPGWTDDWVSLERERFRDLALYALDVELRRLVDRGDRLTARGAAERVLRRDPLRESTLRLLIEIHLAEGDEARARDRYLDYRRALLDVLGLDPTEATRALVAHLLHGN